MMEGNTVRESTRVPGKDVDLGNIETYDSHVVDFQTYEYRDMPIEDKAAGEFANPSLVGNAEVFGWKIVGPGTSGHPKERLCARPLDHPDSDRERRDTERKRAQTDPISGDAAREALRNPNQAVTRAGRGVTLGELLDQQPTREELERRAERSAREAEDPRVQQMVDGIDLDQLTSDLDG